MAKVNLNTIKNWFKTGLKPTQAQFWDTWDSFRHKDDKVLVAELEGLDPLLQSKADIEALQNHIDDKQKHGGSKYKTTISDDVKTASSWGDIPAGTDVATLKDREISSLIDQALFPTVLAYISSQRGLSINNMDTAIKEVGTSYIDPSIDLVFTQGQINNGDGSVAGVLVGDLNRIVFKDPSDTIIDDNGVSSNNINKELPSFELSFGNNTYTFETYHDAGTTTYTDNKGGTDIVASIETAKTDNTPKIVTRNVVARYYRYHYLGARNSHPTTSAAIRTLNKSFLSSSNTDSFSLVIPVNTSEVVIYTISGKIVNANNPATNENLTVIQTAIIIEDAGGNNVNYTKNRIDLGLNGFSSEATFNITIS